MKFDAPRPHLYSTKSVPPKPSRGGSKTRPRSPQLGPPFGYAPPCLPAPPGKIPAPGSVAHSLLPVLRRPFPVTSKHRPARCNSTIQTFLPASAFTPKKKPPSCIGGGLKSLSWLPLPSQPPRARAHHSTTRTTTPAPLAAIPHAQETTPVPAALQPEAVHRA